MTPATKTKTKNAYFEAVGRRKSAVARVRLFPAKTAAEKGSMTINEKEPKDYWPTAEIAEITKAPLKKTGTEKEFSVSAKIKGGGLRAQAEAMRLGISRALLKFNPDFRSILKQEKFLTRDARVKERRKFGLKKARKAPQWSKR